MTDLIANAATATGIVSAIFALGYNWRRVSVIEQRVAEDHTTLAEMRDRLEQVATDISWIKRELNGKRKA